MCPERKTTQIFPTFEIIGEFKVRNSYRGDESFSLNILKELMKDINLLYNPSDINPYDYILYEEDKYRHYAQFIKKGKFKEGVIKFLSSLEGQWVPDGYIETSNTYYLLETKPSYKSGLDVGQRSAIKKYYRDNVNIIIFRSYEYKNNVMKIRILFYTKLNLTILNLDFIKQNNLQILVKCLSN